ncbi:MAG: alkaline phosphatase D [Porticoccaceae bacterium]|jgi:alkaline phosphatase D
MKNFILTVLFFLIAFTSSNAQSNLDLNPCLLPFYHGVASGDPLTDRVILWTRVTPANLGADPVSVQWKIATDTTMNSIVNSGSFVTNQDRDYTVKIDADKLEPNKYYYYQFEAFNKKSPIGRTKTAPTVTIESSRFGVVSCANLEAGFFNVYKIMNERNDMDAVICLGDYIYEYETGGYSPNPSTNRVWQPENEIITLADYRTRYSSYRLDPDLRRNHQLFPWICVWDDHETANNSWMRGAENHDTSEGEWEDRMDYGKKAYFEWLPIRETGIVDPYQIYRAIPYGSNIDLIMLDTRLHGRDIQAGTTGDVVDSPTRELLGSDQRIWMTDELVKSTAQWKIIGQQVMMAPFGAPEYGINEDQWDGYPAERERFFKTVTDNEINNIVVLTGDIHTSWANDLPSKDYVFLTGAGSVGVEFVTPSVTSPGLPISVGVEAIQALNPHMKYIELKQHGFVLLDVNEQRAQADWFYVSTIDTDSNDYAYGASWLAKDKDNHLTKGAAASVPSSSYTAVPLPSTCPENLSLSVSDFSTVKVLSLYPNPSSDFFSIQYNVEDFGQVEVQIIDNAGRLVKNYSSRKESGVWTERYPIENLVEGVYFVKIVSKNNSTIQKLIIKR